MKRAALTLTAMSLAISGCTSLIGVTRDVDASSAAVNKQVEGHIAQMPASQPREGRLQYTTVVKGAWMGASKLPAANAAPLPAAFHEEVTLKFPDRPSIATIAERITKVTGVMVKLSPDMYIPSSSLVPKGGSSTGSSAPTAAGPTPGAPAPIPPAGLPMANAGLTAASVTAEYGTDMDLKFTGKLETLLDTICAKTGANWEYKDGAIVFYRLVTKTFTLKSTPGTSELKSSVGKTGTGTMGTGSSFTSDSVIKMGSAFSVWDNLRESVNSMLTGVGKVAVTEATGTITVTDTREVVEQVGRMLADINKSLSRQVAFRVEVLSVRTDESANYGINWNAVYNRIAASNPSWKFAFGSPSSLASQDAATFGYQILTPASQGGTRGQMSGSEAMLSALSGLGKASIVTTASALTLNRQPVPVAITDQIGYVQSVSIQQNTIAGSSGTTTPTTTPSTSATTVQITPGVVTTGFILNLLPSVADDNSVTLQFSVDISALKKLGTFGSGEMAVQTPEVSAMQFMQRVSMKNGETLVLSGYERTAGQYDRRTVSQDADLLMGGSVAGTKAREAIVILVTPVVTEGS
jgi:type IVB pilus formation R64 PilN family outer membrane protein